MSGPAGVRVFLGIGANLGEPKEQLRAAVRALTDESAFALERVSSLYQTRPVGPIEQPVFLNAVVQLRTRLEPRALLAWLKAYERQAGREVAERWGPRVIDLDILLYGEREVVGPGLTIPHSQLAFRAFVLVPLGELAPELVVPGLGETVEGLRERREDLGDVVRVAGPGWAD